MILLGKNTAYNACILQKQLSKAVGTSRYSDRFSRHYNKDRRWYDAL